MTESERKLFNELRETKNLLRIERDFNRELTEMLDHVCDKFCEIDRLVSSANIVKARSLTLMMDQIRRGRRNANEH